MISIPLSLILRTKTRIDMKEEEHKPENVVYIKSLAGCDTYRCDFCSSDKDVMYNEITDVHTCGGCAHETIVSDLSTYIQNYAKDYAKQKVIEELENMNNTINDLDDANMVLQLRIEELKQE